MRFKLIMALVDEAETEDILKAAREAGATGCSVITSARGEGLKPEKTFLGLDLAGARDLLLFLVAEPLSRDILETIAAAGQFDERPGSGIAFQIDIEDAVGLSSQMETLTQEVEDQI
ncbi:MAG: P-II family nitrogen regulator [Rhodospirillales bacterium]|nr:MAG: P-II family nitrogen regulator [Rhodospirillales bacterium]